MRFDGDVDGVGDEAIGKTNDDSSFYFNRMIAARAGNLVIEVHLKADGETEIPSAILVSTMSGSAKNIIASAPRQ